MGFFKRGKKSDEAAPKKDPTPVHKDDNEDDSESEQREFATLRQHALLTLKSNTLKSQTPLDSSGSKRHKKKKKKKVRQKTMVFSTLMAGCLCIGFDLYSVFGTNGAGESGNVQRR